MFRTKLLHQSSFLFLEGLGSQIPPQLWKISTWLYITHRKAVVFWNALSVSTVQIYLLQDLWMECKMIVITCVIRPGGCCCWTKCAMGVRDFKIRCSQFRKRGKIVLNRSLIYTHAPFFSTLTQIFFIFQSFSTCLAKIKLFLVYVCAGD
jgi:hypothetical protein